MLTAEETRIPRHMSMVFLGDGTCSLINKTIRVSGAMPP